MKLIILRSQQCDDNITTTANEANNSVATCLQAASSRPPKIPKPAPAKPVFGEEPDSPEQIQLWSGPPVVAAPPAATGDTSEPMDEDHKPVKPEAKSEALDAVKAEHGAVTNGVAAVTNASTSGEGAQVGDVDAMDVDMDTAAVRSTLLWVWLILLLERLCAVCFFS